MAITNQPRNYQVWYAITATPNDFNLDAGAYGLTLSVTGAGTASLQKLVDGSPTNGGAVYVPVMANLTANGYVELHIPAGQYRLALTGFTGVTGEIARIGPFAGR